MRYDSNWLLHGVALSEDLPLRDHQFLPIVKDSAVGAVDDARPDRWGERIIRTFDRPARLSLMEYLYFAGSAPLKQKHCLYEKVMRLLFDVLIGAQTSGFTVFLRL